jgi:hypothetical protein
MSVAPSSSKSYVEDDTLSTCGIFSYALLRISIIFTLMALSMLIPNIHLLMIFGGSILGTITNIYIPVIFYNRAYSYTEKNQKLEKARKDGDEEPLMGMEPDEETPPLEDKRWGIKLGNIFVVVLGTIFGIWGLVYIILEMKDGKAKADEA